MSYKILTKMRKNQKAVYWEYRPGTDEFGNQRFADPVELDVYWVEKTEIFRNAKGEEQSSKSKVFVGQRVKPQSVLWKGRMQDANLANPFRNENAFEIAAYQEVPTLRKGKVLRVAWL